jgi:hypothetical protein
MLCLLALLPVWGFVGWLRLKKEKASADNKIIELQARIRALELGAKEERVKVVGSKITAAANAAVASSGHDNDNDSSTSGATTGTTGSVASSSTSNDGKRSARPTTALSTSGGGRKQLSFESWKELRRHGNGQRDARAGNISTWTLPGRIPSEVVTDLSSYKAAAAANASSTSPTKSAGEADDAPVRLAPAKKKRPSMSVANASSSKGVRIQDPAAATGATQSASNDTTSPSTSNQPSATTATTTDASPTAVSTSSPPSPLMSAASGASSSSVVSGSGVDFVSLLQKQSAESKIPQGKMWKPRITLRNHMDGVRAVAFDNDCNALISGSEDGTAKWWNIDAAVHPLNKKKVVAGLEPVYTFLGHRGILSLYFVLPAISLYRHMITSQLPI